MTEPDDIWNALSPAAKADWVRAMQPEPPVTDGLTACPECAEVAVTRTAGPLGVCLNCDWTDWHYDPADPGFTPDPERCPAGGAHTWAILEQTGTGRTWWGCEECGVAAPNQEEWAR